MYYKCEKCEFGSSSLREYLLHGKVHEAGKALPPVEEAPVDINALSYYELRTMATNLGINWQGQISKTALVEAIMARQED